MLPAPGFGFTPEERDAMLRHDQLSFLHRTFQQLEPGKQFIPEWHLDAMAFELQRVLRGENRRLIITMPPRNLKSITVSVAF